MLLTQGYTAVSGKTGIWTQGSLTSEAMLGFATTPHLMGDYLPCFSIEGAVGLLSRTSVTHSIPPCLPVPLTECPMREKKKKAPLSISKCFLGWKPSRADQHIPLVVKFYRNLLSNFWFVLDLYFETSKVFFQDKYLSVHWSAYRIFGAFLFLVVLLGSACHYTP